MHWATHIQKQRRPSNYNVGKGWGVNQQATQVNERDIMFHVLEAIRIRDMKFFRDQAEKDEYDDISDAFMAMRYYLSARVKSRDVSNILDVWNLNNIGSNVHAITVHNRKQTAKDMEQAVRLSILNSITKNHYATPARTIGDAMDKDRGTGKTAASKSQEIYGDFRAATVKAQYLRDDNGEWYDYSKLNCCSKFLLGYFWFLKHVKQTSRVKTHVGENFTFADLGFPPKEVFYNYADIESAMKFSADVRFVSRLNDKVSAGDCERLAMTLKRILNDGHLQRQLHIKNNITTLIGFWDKSQYSLSECNFNDLMDDLHIITNDMKLVQRAQMKIHMKDLDYGTAGGYE